MKFRVGIHSQVRTLHQFRKEQPGPVAPKQLVKRTSYEGCEFGVDIWTSLHIYFQHDGGGDGEQLSCKMSEPDRNRFAHVHACSNIPLDPRVRVHAPTVFCHGAFVSFKLIVQVQPHLSRGGEQPLFQIGEILNKMSQFKTVHSVMESGTCFAHWGRLQK